mgnify:CR=1 FL=1
MFKTVFFNKIDFILFLFYFNYFFLFIVFIININKFYNREHFIIPINDQNYYFIPKNKGGQKILNQDKKGLHLSNLIDDYSDNIVDEDIKYSIQIFSNNSYELVNNYKKRMIEHQDSIFISNELFIASLKTSIGIEYLLLYKNFETRLKGFNYCQKYAHFIENCIIVNAQNLN